MNFKRLIYNENSKVNLLLCTLLSFSYFSIVFTGVIRHFIPNTFKLDTLLIYGLLGLIILNALPVIIKRIRIFDITLAVFFVFIFIISMIRGENDTSIFLEILSSVVFQCLPLYIAAICVRDYDELFKMLYWVGLIILISTFFQMSTFDSEENVYSQYYGYCFLSSSILLSFKLFKKFDVITLILVFLSVFGVFSSGARGPLVFIVIYVLFAFILNSQKSKSFSFVFGLLLIVVLGIFVAVNFEKILEMLLAFLEDAGLSVRSLSRLEDSTFFKDDERMSIYKLAISKICESPFLGYGIINDRFLIAKEIFTNEEIIGSYPHNIILEMLMQYGIIFGGLLLTGLFAFIVYLFVSKSGNLSEKNAVLIFICIGFLPLMVSGSYLDYENFYLFFGIAISVSRTVKIRRERRRVIGEN